MKRYFIHAIPVKGEPGELKIGDWYIWKDNQQICQAMGNLNLLNNHLDANQIAKLNLYLCSDDVLPDNYELPSHLPEDYLQEECGKYGYDIGFDAWFYGNIEWIKRKGAFVRIAPISKDAIWIKPLDLINEEDIQLWYAYDVIKTYSNGVATGRLFFDHLPEQWEIQDQAEHWAEHINMSGHNRGYTLSYPETPPYVHHAKIRNTSCQHFH